MGMFNSLAFVNTSLTDLTGVVAATRRHFEAQEYQVSVTDTLYGHLLSISKGGFFKSVLGMKTALNIEITRMGQGVSIKAGVGIFGQQALPSLISLFVFWPVLLTQISGLVKQSKLDDEAIRIIGETIRVMEQNR
jgi:hypothetical protein